MKKELARKLIQPLASAEAPIQEIESFVSSLEGDDKEKLIHILGQIVGSHSELILHIKNQFPEFDPEGKGKDLYDEAKKLQASKYS